MIPLDEHRGTARAAAFAPLRTAAAFCLRDFVHAISLRLPVGMPLEVTRYVAFSRLFSTLFRLRVRGRPTTLLNNRYSTFLN